MTSKDEDWLRFWRVNCHVLGSGYWLFTINYLLRPLGLSC
jgi:hypothetical protein